MGCHVIFRYISPNLTNEHGWAKGKSGFQFRFQQPANFASNFTLRPYLEAADCFAGTQVQALGPPFCRLATSPSPRGSNISNGGAGGADGGAAMSCLLPPRQAHLPPASQATLVLLDR
jgi:hypothetical protein